MGAERAGKPVLPNSQAKVAVLIKNDDEESHKELKELFPGGTLSEAIAADGISVDMQPLDEELLAELEEEPALQKGEFDFSWGTADKLYKSEAIDAFGIKYLLGVFETQEEAVKAFE